MVLPHGADMKCAKAAPARPRLVCKAADSNPETTSSNRRNYVNLSNFITPCINVGLGCHIVIRMHWVLSTPWPLNSPQHGAN